MMCDEHALLIIMLTEGREIRRPYCEQGILAIIFGLKLNEFVVRKFIEAPLIVDRIADVSDSARRLSNKCQELYKCVSSGKVEMQAI
jgi:hypothetical protein